MGIEIRHACLVETRRLLLLMGMVFAFILLVEFFELPYSGFFSSLFEPNNPNYAPTHDLPSINFTDSNGSDEASGTASDLPSINFKHSNGSDEASGTVKISDTSGSTISDVKNDFGSRNNETFDDPVNDEIDPEDESPFETFVTDHNSTIEGAVGNTSFQLDMTRENGVLLQRSSADMNASSATSSGVADDNILGNKDEPESLKVNSVVPGPLVNDIPAKKKGLKRPVPALVTVPEMDDMLAQSRASYSAVKPRWTSSVDQDLLKVKSLIENAPIVENSPFDVSLYRNFSAFKRSYEMMEKTLKVYVYGEGNRPIFHQPPLKGIYASEGWFMKQMKASKQFVTKKPKKAHLFYLPFSSRELEVNLYVHNSHSRKPLIKVLSNYIETIRTKYNFWNRTGGSDHFLVACHDWAPAETRKTMPNCIRSLCNSDIQEGFQFGKDASLPETYVKSPQNPLRQLGGNPPSKRQILAFFAGSMHGYLRPILLSHWEKKDPDMKIFGPLRRVRGQMSYVQYMKSSKYCICAKGFEVNSPRVVEAIFYECIPVIISDNFVPPFFETLNWESFAVFVLEKDIPNLKNILSSIPKKRYLEMYQRVRQVQQHFLWHSRPIRYDVFHMILHSIWYNRVIQTRPW